MCSVCRLNDACNFLAQGKPDPGSNIVECFCCLLLALVLHPAFWTIHKTRVIYELLSDKDKCNEFCNVKLLLVDSEDLWRKKENECFIYICINVAKNPVYAS